MVRILVAIGAFAVIIFVIFLFSPYSIIITGADMQVHEKFKTIAIGQERKEVISLLGVPSFSERKSVGQLQGIRVIHTLGDISKSKSYSTWHNGPVVVYLVAYDENGCVVAKVDGRI